MSNFMKAGFIQWQHLRYLRCCERVFPSSGYLYRSGIGIWSNNKSMRTLGRKSLVHLPEDGNDVRLRLKAVFVPLRSASKAFKRHLPRFGFFLSF